MSANVSYFTGIRNPSVRLNNAAGTTLQSLCVGAGTKLESLLATNSDAAVTTVLQFVMTIGAIDYIIGEVAVPAGAGTNGTTKAVDALNVVDLPWLRSDGVNRYLYLATGTTLKVKAKVAVAGVNTIDIVGQCGDQ